jgi:Glycosyltransferase
LKLNKFFKIINFKKNPYPYIKKSDLFILSSNFEGLPNVLLEAIALNKFVISSNCPTGPSEILDNGKGGLLFKVGNHEELSKKIIYALKNKKKCNKKLSFARKRLSRFDFLKNLLKYYNTLNSI